MRQLMVVVVIAVVSGCQCYQAPGDFADAGRADASTDAGGDAGFDAGLPECSFASECAPPTTRLCNWFGSGDGGVRSCVAKRCVTECAVPRTCQVSLDAGTLACDDQSKIRQIGSMCQSMFTAFVEGSTCAGMSPGDQFPFTASGACRWTSPLGEIISLDQNTEFLGNFPALGGVCVGINLPTGAERWQFNCPNCQFVMRP